MRTKTKFAALFAALTIAAPLALANPAAAAPGHGGGMMGPHPTGHMDAFHDRNHRPPMKVEYRPHQPKGHYRWRTGQWSWSRDHWAWAPGIWIRF